VTPHDRCHERCISAPGGTARTYTRHRPCCRRRRGAKLASDGAQAAEDLAARDPAVDAAAVVADLESLALDRLDEVQVLVAHHTAEHDVTDHRDVVAERLDRAALAAGDLADHAVAARPELHGLAARRPGLGGGTGSGPMRTPAAPRDGDRAPASDFMDAILCGLLSAQAAWLSNRDPAVLQRRLIELLAVLG